jgi:superfamily II DNA or RNA helicase
LYKISKELLEDLYPEAIHIGMTATPRRLGKEQLGDYFDILIGTPTPSELTEKGFLAPLRYFRPDSSEMPDLTDVSIRGEDYDEIELKNACDRDELIIAAVRDWHNICYGKKTLAFCVDVVHAERVAQAFNTVGIPAECVTGETPAKERVKMYERLRRGETLVLTSINVLSIGFDEPSVEVGLMLRPTMSEALHLQMIGRIMRTSPETGKEYGMILDQSGNSTRLINPEGITDYELPYSKPKGNGVAPTKTCPVCDRRTYNFVSDCACGFHWASSVEINDSVMIEVTPGNTVSGREVKEQFQAFRKDNLLRQEPPILAEKKFAQIYNFAPPIEWYECSLFGGVFTRQNFDYYLKYLMDVAKDTEKDELWVAEQLVVEFGDKIEELVAA